MNGTMIVIEESTMINNEGKYYVKITQIYPGSVLKGTSIKKTYCM